MTSDDASLPEIRIRPEAEAEISEAFRWYEDKSKGLGSEFMRALDASLSYIPAIDHTGLNPRALTEQLPAFAGRRAASIFTREGGWLHF